MITAQKTTQMKLSEITTVAILSTSHLIALAKRLERYGMRRIDEQTRLMRAECKVSRTIIDEDRLFLRAKVSLAQFSNECSSSRMIGSDSNG